MEYRCLTDLDQIKEYVDNDRPIAFDFETSPNELYRREDKAALDAHKAHIVGISFSVDEGDAIYVPLTHDSGTNAEQQDELWAFLKTSVFENKSRVKIAHNLAFEAMFLYAKGIIVQQPCYDTIAAAQLTLKAPYEFRTLHDSRLKLLAMLKSYKGKVTVKIDSLAASAASVIAMAGDEVLMSPLGLIMIHNPLTIAAGDVSDMQKAIDMLDEVKESIINAYEMKSGLSRTKISHMMDCETWLSAKKAVELGFADSIMFTDNDTDTDDSYEFSQREVSNRLMNQLIKKNTPTAGVKISDLQTRLNLLK